MKDIDFIEFVIGLVFVIIAVGISTLPIIAMILENKILIVLKN